MNERTTHTTDSSGSNTGNSWMDHPAINGMDPVKLELIRLAAKQTAGKSGRSLAPVMMALITSANKKGIQFTPQIIIIYNSIRRSSYRNLLHRSDSDIVFQW